jgi:DNA repair protein RadC
LAYGPTSLNTYELLAIILRTGTKEYSVIDVAKALVNDLTSLSELKDKTIDEMVKIKGIGRTKAIMLKASIELGRRINENRIERLQITSPKVVFDLLSYDLRDLKQEVLIALYMDLKTNLIAKKEIFRGSLNQSLVHPREIFKYAVKYSAYQIILVHNHPSGDPQPSKQDIEMTKAIKKAGKMMQIHVLDHIIIGYDSYLSINAYTNTKIP